MQKFSLGLAVILCFATFGVRADYGVINRGEWPADWPRELEPLRKQARTLDGPKGPLLHYAIPFENREQFEAAWPHILKISPKGSSLVLRRGANFFLGEKSAAGVVIHCPECAAGEGAAKGVGQGAVKSKSRPAEENSPPRQEITIDVIVDGNVVDLNRIPLPADTRIVDLRFPASPVTEGSGKSP
jgi:hypothetical protein